MADLTPDQNGYPKARHRARMERAIAGDERHDEVFVVWQCPNNFGPPTSVHSGLARTLV